MLVLGPGTLVRPAVLAGGALAAVLAAPTPAVAALAPAVCAAAVGLGRWLDARWPAASR
ncbi:MAG: hypothetical protein R3F59_26880 [Myxococcota bacterium]